MSAPSFPFKTGWSVLAAAGFGLTAGFLLRPESPPLSRNPPPENAIPRMAKDSPLGRRRALPQTEARLETLLKAGSPSQQIAAALDFAEINSVEEIRDLLENANRFPAHSAEEVAIGTLLKRWLELDAAGAVDYCRKNQAEFLPKLLANWSHDHPAEATAWVRAMPPGTAQRNAWLGPEAGRDPDKAWEMLGRTFGLHPNTGVHELQFIINGIVGRDVEKALISLETMPPALLTAAQEAIAVKLMQTDPARAWVWVRQLPQPGRATVAALGVSFAADPAQAMALLKSLPGREQEWIASDFPTNLLDPKSHDFLDLLRQDTSLRETTRQKFAENIFGRYNIRKDPSSAMELISFMSPQGQIKAIQTSVEQWARWDDPATLRTWVETLPEGPLRTAALETQAKFAPAEKSPGRTGPESLADEIKRDASIQPTDPRLTQLTAEQLGEIMKGGRAEEHYWRERQLLLHLGAVNSPVATAWLESTPIDAKTGPIAAQFSAQWAEADPAAAAAWVIKLPAGDLARTAAANVARHYQRYAPEQAAAWAAQLPPGPVQDAARKVMTER